MLLVPRYNGHGHAARNRRRSGTATTATACWTSSRSRSRAGQIGCMLGPSGCGKTTVLRCIAGFEQIAAGRIAINGEDVSRAGYAVPPERRRIGMVFQDYALFPHLTVARQHRLRPARAGRRRARAARRRAARHRRHGARRRPLSRTSSRAASSSASRSRARSRRGRSCCCSTSRSPTSTSTCASAWASKCATSSSSRT